jgi:two-component system, OmpR family, alkaline phosphatase synthesis response regulator PhoP
MLNSSKILVVDDEKDIVELLKYNLAHSGFDVITAFNGFEAIEKLSNYPDLILLDVMMPGLDGFEVCKKIRNKEEYKSIPIIFLTAKSSEQDEVIGLNLGANDYIQKPISINKIIARINSNLRINTKQQNLLKYNDDISIGPLILSKERYLVTLDSKQIDLARKEFEILHFLASNPGKVFKRERILSNVWGDDVCVVERTVDVHLLNIRKKFGEYAGLIETIKGVGYRLKDFS